jgi:DNA-binding response OmpR family regulator
MTRNRILSVVCQNSVAAQRESILTAAGYLVDTVNTPEQARCLLEVKPFDLVIVGYQPPSFDGIALVESVQKSRVPVLVLYSEPKRAASYASSSDYESEADSFLRIVAYSCTSPSPEIEA